MQSTTHTNTHKAGTAAAAFRHRWPVLALGICALLALAILAISAEPAGAAPAGSNRQSETNILQQYRSSDSAGGRAGLVRR